MQFGKDVRVRHEKFGAVVFDTLREKVFVANETGAQIICLIEGNKKSQKDAIETLAKQYGCNPETIKSDVDEFITRLKNSGLTREETGND